MNQRIGQRIAPILVAPQTLLTPATKKVAVDAASGGAWVNRTSQLVSRAGVDKSTPGNICNSVGVKHAPSPFLIGIISTSPPCGINRSLKVENKQQSNSPGLGRNTLKLDAFIGVKLPDSLYYTSIFSKVIGHKLSDSSSDELYLRCRINFSGDAVQNQTPQFMDLGLPTINALDESSVLSTPAIRI